MGERAVVTLAVLACFTILAITGHMTASMLPVFSVLLGLVGTAWFSGHQTAVQATVTAATTAAVAALAKEATKPA